jgi:hypothetical protein
MARGNGPGDPAHADHVELVEGPELDEMMPEPEPVRAPVDNSQVAAQADRQREAQGEQPEQLRQRLFTGAAAPPPAPRKRQEPGGDDEPAPAAEPPPPAAEDEGASPSAGLVGGRRLVFGPPAPVGPPRGSGRRPSAVGWGGRPRTDGE